MRVYMQVELTYAAHIWHNPVEGRYRRRALLRLACRVQNRCLRLINGAFRATPTASLETLAYVPPLDLYLTGRLAAYRRRAAAGGIDELVKRKGDRIKNTLGRPHIDVSTSVVGYSTPVPRDWPTTWLRDPLEAPATQRQPRLDKIRVWEVVNKRWTERWRAAPRSPEEAVPQPSNQQILRLHQSLHKAESSILTQLRTGKIGLADFLYRAGVPDIVSPICSCGQANETPKHVLIHCRRYHDVRAELRMGGRPARHKTAVDDGGGSQEGDEVVVKNGFVKPVPTSEQAYQGLKEVS